MRMYKYVGFVHFDTCELFRHGSRVKNDALHIVVDLFISLH